MSRNKWFVVSAVAAALWAGVPVHAQDHTGKEHPGKEQPKQDAVTSATAEIINAKGEKIGSATLTQTEKGVSIKLEVSGLTAGEHAFHIHNVGKADPPDFKSSGGHYNPEKKQHGHKNKDGPHLGDLGNLTVGEDGKVAVEILAADVTLADGPHSLLANEGTSLVIHAKGDDEATDPAGNAGDRIAAGIIKKAEGEKKEDKPAEKPEHPDHPKK